MTDAVLSSPMIQSIGWALLHFVWQGTLIGAATAVALSTIDPQRASTRYLVACAGLLLMLMTAVVSAFPNRSAPTLDALSLGAPGDFAAAVSIERILPMAVIVWIVGVALLSIRLIAACVGVERMKRATREIDEAVTVRLGALTRKLGISHAVRVFASDRVRVPTVVGCLRPVILLPVSVLTGLPAAHLDAVLAHELAHVRRHDYLVNAVQAIVETLLFYHPAVWWCSRQIRIEREHCCDDLVVEACGDRIGYATALAQLEELRGLEPMVSVNVTGGRLIDRIRRVLGYSRVSEPFAGRWMMVAVLPLVVAALVVTPVMTSANGRGTAANAADIALQEPPPAPPLPPTPPATPLPSWPQAAPRVPAAPAPPASPAPPVDHVDQSVRPAPPAAPAPPAPPAAPAPPAPPAPQSVPPVPPAAPAAPAPPAPRPDVLLQFDPESIAEEVSRASRQLAESFDELRRATEEIKAQQEALRRAMAELSARGALLRDGADMTEVELRKQLESLRQAFEALNAR